MLKKLLETQRSRDIRPLNIFYLPLWLRWTWRGIRNNSTDRSYRKFSFYRLFRFIHPNLDCPIFIIGAPRSGTTFLGSCISYLPEISYFFEPVITKAAVRTVYTGEWNYSKASWIYRFVYKWLLRIQLEPDLIFCEKTPGNCFILPFLYRTFPKARFIHIIRDGRDSAISLAKKPWYQKAMNDKYRRDADGYLCGSGRRFWVEPDRVKQYENTSDRHRCIWLWKRYIEEAKKGSENIPNDQFLVIRYEDLVTNPEFNANRILDFLNINNINSREIFVETVNSRASKDSVALWKKELTDSEYKIMKKEAGDLLELLNYTNS